MVNPQYKYRLAYILNTTLATQCNKLNCGSSELGKLISDSSMNRELV